MTEEELRKGQREGGKEGGREGEWCTLDGAEEPTQCKLFGEKQILLHLLNKCGVPSNCITAIVHITKSQDSH